MKRESFSKLFLQLMTIYYFFLLLELQLISASLCEEQDSSLDSDEKSNDKSSFTSKFV